MALGPIISGLLIRFTGQVLSVFYLALCLHLIYSFLVWFIIPESLTKGDMELAKARYADSLRAHPDSSLVGGFTRSGQRLFAFLRPLAILRPTEKAPGNTLKGRRKEWNLTLLAVAYGFMGSLDVSVLKVYSVTSKMFFKGYYLLHASIYHCDFRLEFRNCKLSCIFSLLFLLFHSLHTGSVSGTWFAPFF